ncbi:MAG: toll/interleukin-1 receptor domain-containing protein [Anaerolineae bacterium]
MTHIFISYAKKDTRELALALNQALNAISGVTAWVDQSLRAGKSWDLQIQSEIDRCDYMIVLYSPDINRHKNGEEESYVLTEIAYAKYTAK